MKNIILLFLTLLAFNLSISQNITNEKLGGILETISDSIQGNNGRWQFSIEETFFICLTDSTQNRMRIISPIIELEKIDEEQKGLALVANFHTALDVRYAISNNIMWSAFIHPLKELTEEQVEDAVSQVYYACQNFGTTYSSTTLVFPGSENDDKPQENNTSPKQKF